MTQSYTQLNASPVFQTNSTPNGHRNGESNIEYSPSKSKAIIADFEMKMAKKDVEIHKLQAALTSRNAAQQRSIAGIIPN